jgi:hypothetical protein
LKALGELFLQVLKLCETAGLVKLGHVALDARTPRLQPFASWAAQRSPPNANKSPRQKAGQRFRDAPGYLNLIDTSASATLRPHILDHEPRASPSTPSNAPER